VASAGIAGDVAAGQGHGAAVVGLDAATSLAGGIARDDAITQGHRAVGGIYAAAYGSAAASQGQAADRQRSRLGVENPGEIVRIDRLAAALYCQRGGQATH